MENNFAIAGKLRQIAALLQEQEVAFKPAAYRRAAQVIEELPNDVSTYGNEKELKKLSGIGEAIAKKIIEYLETGQMEFLVMLQAEQGGISADLMDIEGLGPKRVRQLQKEVGITSVAQLINAAEQGKLQSLPLWDEKMEAKVLENAKRVGERVKRFPREEAKDDVELLIRTIKNVKGVDRCDVAGSFRRKKETVGDIDILLVTESAQEVSDAISTLSIVRNVAVQGDKKISFDLHNGLRVDVRLVKADQWGAALMYFTGSKDHNIAVRRVAIKHGLKLNEYGLFNGEEIVASKEEEDIYKALDLRYYEPKERAGGLN
ncbi:MAG: nucleotidyltransferase domain-containing protein [Candidatus Peribacteraceae bacterium]|jgi:DNA polymerase (family 10)|nr:nucleotidyltransferase domain-containing protein [Candidatus Peribacteraceae bacterium]